MHPRGTWRHATARARPALLAAALLGACDERVNSVELGVAATRRGPPALLCREDPPADAGADAATPYLITRARETGRLSVVADFFGIEGGVPGCLPTELTAFCEDHCCRHLNSARVCLTLTLPTPPPVGPVELANWVSNTLQGQTITRDAPGGLVVIRVTVTTQPCGELATGPGPATPLDDQRVVGCAYSCPVVLDAIQGEVLLDLPVLGDQCAPTVRRCATFFEAESTGVCQ
jgi:hypothetical protein